MSLPSRSGKHETHYNTVIGKKGKGLKSRTQQIMKVIQRFLKKGHREPGTCSEPVEVSRGVAIHV